MIALDKLPKHWKDWTNVMNGNLCAAISSRIDAAMGCIEVKYD
jgi:hypothetical protein